MSNNVPEIERIAVVFPFVVDITSKIGLCASASIIKSIFFTISTNIMN